MDLPTASVGMIADDLERDGFGYHVLDVGRMGSVSLRSAMGYMRCNRGLTLPDALSVKQAMGQAGRPAGDVVIARYRDLAECGFDVEQLRRRTTEFQQKVEPTESMLVPETSAVEAPKRSWIAGLLSVVAGMRG